MTKYVVVGPFDVCGVAPGGIVDGDQIPDVEWLLAACAIAKTEQPKLIDGEAQHGEDSFNKR